MDPKKQLYRVAIQFTGRFASTRASVFFFDAISEEVATQAGKSVFLEAARNHRIPEKDITYNIESRLSTQEEVDAYRVKLNQRRN